VGPAATAILLLSLPTLLFASACQIVAGYEAFKGPAPHPCDVLPASKLDDKGLATLVLSKQSDGSCYWIDKTEVTVKQYSTFLDEHAEPNWDDESCSWKKGIVADGGVLATNGPSNPIADNECSDDTQGESDPFNSAKPIRCIDWCDARAFCTWAGKELCVGYNVAGLLEPTDLPDQWGNACVANGGELPYGNGSEPSKGVCNVGFVEKNGECFEYVAQYECAPTSVGRFPGCKGPPGTVDMIGNVAEWVLSCRPSPDGGRDSACQVRGGSYQSSLDTATCYKYENPPRSTRRADIGLRCCDSLTQKEVNQVNRK
jgi:formylglycine-generating enzyme required for sulfatase activity